MCAAQRCARTDRVTPGDRRDGGGWPPRRRWGGRSRSSARPAGPRPGSCPRGASPRGPHHRGPARAVGAGRTSPGRRLTDGAQLRPAEVDPAEPRTGCRRDIPLQHGPGSPARCIATRLRDSPGLSLRQSANATTRRAGGTPGQPAARRTASSSSAAVTMRWCSAASATATPASYRSVRARSMTVRAGEVTADRRSRHTRRGAASSATRPWVAVVARCRNSPRRAGAAAS